MKVVSILSLAAATSAFVIPDTETANALREQLDHNEPTSSHPFWDAIKNPETIWEDIEEKFTEATGSVKHHFEEAVEATRDTTVHYSEQFESAFAGEAWLDSTEQDLDLFEHPPDRPPHRGPPWKRPDHPGKKPDHPGKKPDHPPHHKRPHHGPANLTVYELISKSKYTTKLAKAIDEFPDLVDLLNGTTANFTVFAPTDKAFEKIPKHAPKPSKEFLKKLLTYHVSTEFYPAGRVLVTRTIPTALEAEAIGKVPQRLSTQVGLRGLTVNFYSRIVAVDIFGTNGVIHGLDSILLPPPKVADIITAIPSAFSTLELGLIKTGLFPYFNDTATHEGGTLFAPSNSAFQRLGPKVNAFLFGKFGQKYLKALLLYHAVDNITLYSDAIYKEGDASSLGRIPKGRFHVDLPTGLKDKSLSVDIARFGRLIEIRINGYDKVSVSDGIAADGVIQVVPAILIPPKAPGGPPLVADDSLSVDELKEVLEPFVESEDVLSWEL